MVLCSEVHSTVLHTFELLDAPSDGLNLISATNDQESFIVEMRFKPSDVRFDSSKVCSTVLRTPPQHHPKKNKKTKSK
ncbi:hypothetical protein RHMOL_Rhmol01G0143500 [Rhododendron molle]|uniref:Uncharacterized protein n=1 Tax=Rhododendron molle TaxID=49168 RepID=A0ACC0Q2W5_RHOML|nr:hypothetical protein RHMOL_Rhmol01G0143500 [Rhododendron molle]